MAARWLLGSLVSLGAMSCTDIGAADWPQFRGPNANGIVTETKLPTEWSPEKNVAWKISLPGVAWSCPIVVGDKIFVTTAVADGQPKPRGGFGGGRPMGPMGGGGSGFQPGGSRGGSGPDKIYSWKVICLDRSTGKEIWAKTTYEGKPKYGTHNSNTFASETPVSDGERVFAYFGATGNVVTYDLAGTELWKRDLGAFPMMSNWGTSSSPRIHEGTLYIQCDNESKSFLLALDAKTGEQKWKVDRNERSSWCTPYIWTTKSRTDLVVGGGQKVRGYNPADGKLIWELSLGGGQANASPVGDEEHLYFGTGMGGGGGGRPGGAPGGAPGGGRAGGNSGTLFAIKAGVTGDISLKAGESANAGVAWSVPRAVPAAASPLIYQGYVYTFERQGGLVSCYDAKTGKATYSKERISNAAAFWSSPWAYDGKIFCMDETGTTHILKAGPTFDVLGTNKLGRDVYWSTPAIAGGSIILRGVDSLYCIK